jgi:pimeloyl-ACP methyl ester carboxylesterase
MSSRSHPGPRDRGIFEAGSESAEMSEQLSSTQAGALHFVERGTGQPLLLIHGLMASFEMFEPVLDQFAAHHRVIAPDLRGHGRSRELPPPYTVRQLAADLSDLLERLGVESVDVLGYSQGGAVAQQLALDDPARCRRLVLGCTYAYNMATRREWVEGHLAPWLVAVLGPRGMTQLGMRLGARELDPARMAWLVRILASQDRKLMVAAWKEAMAFDSRSRLAEIVCPTLIVAGSDDAGVPIHHAHMLHDGIRNSKLVVIEGARHTLIWTHTDEFVRIVEEFLLEPASKIGPSSPICSPT